MKSHGRAKCYNLLYQIAKEEKIMISWTLKKIKINKKGRKVRRLKNKTIKNHRIHILSIHGKQHGGCEFRRKNPKLDQW